MKTLIIKTVIGIARFGLNVIYFFMKLFTKQKNKIVFLSRQSDEPNLNFIMIADEIRRLDPDAEIFFSCKEGMKSDMNLSYAFLILRQMAAMASARTVITDSYSIPVSLLKHRKGLIIIQIWHALAAIKKFGWQTVGLSEGSSPAVAQAMRMHSGYTWVIIGSKKAVPIYAEAFRCSPDIILPIGLPRSDVIINGDRSEAKSKLSEKYPQTVGKKVVVYVPTMRRAEAVDCKEFIDSFDYENCSLIIKLHPLDRHTVIDDDRVITDTFFPTDTALLFADAIVTDYSATCCDAALLDTPVYFYLPDLDRYKEQCGLNIDPTQAFPEISFTNGSDCAAAIARDPNPEIIKKMREELAGGCDGHGTNYAARLALGESPENL